MLSTFWPVFCWQGRGWVSGNPPLSDSIYYYKPSAIPFLSTFYPPQIVCASLLSRLKNIDLHFRLHQVFLFSHFLLCSGMTFWYFSRHYDFCTSLFGAISMTYMASAVKLQHPCTIFTVCWIPGVFLGGWPGAVSLAMSILGGYWPILIYFIPVFFGAYYLWGYEFWPLLTGLLLATPQIVKTALYYPKSIRTWPKKQSGSVPWWKFFDLLGGDRTFYKINGVFGWEMALFSGFLTFPLICCSESRIWPLALISCVFCLLWGPFRHPCRGLHLFSFSLVWMATSGFSGIPTALKPLFLGIQAWSLLRNSRVYPWHPFAERIKKPSEWFSREPDLNKFPYFTGYFHELPTRGYTGGFSLKETCLKHGITNPDGEALHDRF